MKKILTVCAIFAMPLLLTRCATNKAASTVKTGGETNATPGVATMDEGRAIWEEKCAKCHKLYSPGSYTVASWEKILPPMSKKAKLDETQALKVRTYIMAHARVN